MADGNVSFLRIPSNIKQDFAPFQATGAGLQKFSFKPSREVAPACLLNMVPSSISKNTDMFIRDLSYRNQHQHKFSNFSDILNYLPSIQIREYLPDTKLDQSLNFFQDLFTNIFKGHTEKEKMDAGENTEDITAKSESLTEKLKGVVNTVMETIDSDGWMGIFCNGTDIDALCASDDQKAKAVVKMTYFLYYCLQSSLTTNIYELPCVSTGNKLYDADGHPGWEGSSGMRLLPDFVKNLPVVGKMLDSLFGNMGINFTPWWDAAEGSKTKAQELEFKFSLFNDNSDAAVANFIFVATIIAHCRWIQYNILQHSSSLYDVVIPGVGKLYACMGQFDVQYKGTLREPSQTVVSKLHAHVGSRYNPSVVAANGQIKIPDVYDITMKFQSLLPQNFNTFVFNFNQVDLMNFGKAEQESGFTKLTDAIELIKDDAAGEW